MFFGVERLFVAVCLVAVVLCACSGAGFARESTAALVRAKMPGEDIALGDALEKQLSAAGYNVESINADQLSDNAVLVTDRFDLLVLPNAAELPGKSTQAIENYLKQGGDIIALNAPLWQRALVKVDGTWMTRDDYQLRHAGELPQHVLADFTPESVAGWQRTSNAMDSAATYETIPDGPKTGMRALHAIVSDLRSWDNFGPRGLNKPFPEGHTLTVFSAKGGPRTTQLAIEWAETDGSRWIATVALTPEWRQYVLRPEDFIYWNSAPNRGGLGDRLRPENAVSLSVGLAFTHTGSVAGRHEYWVGPFGTAKLDPQLAEVLDGSESPRLDMLSPSYKLFDVHGAASLATRKDQAILEPASIPVPAQLRSLQPRPCGGGFDKGRDWRWIPLLEARAANGEWRGIPAALTVHTDGPYKGGVWASFGLVGSEPYKSPAALDMIRQIAARMKNGVFILDGGANYYTYFEDQTPTMGMRVANVSQVEHKNLSGRLRVTRTSDSTTLATLNLGVLPKPGETGAVSTTWKPVPWPEGGCEVTVELLEDGKTIDLVRHSMDVWKPKEKKEFVTAKDGEFILNGKRWRAHGVNYMPSSGIGSEDGSYFEHWMGARSYDPEVIERDLSHIQDMGLNALSIFCYGPDANDQNLVDILSRLEKRGMKANVSLRPGTPLDFEWDQVSHIIERCRLAQSDTVFAYDLAWEPMFGTTQERMRWDGEWEKWIIERYTSIANAEKDWGFPVPRDESGKITNPNASQIDTDGKWRRMSAAYRRFLDTLLYKKYGAARRMVRGIDANHLVSFRMAEAANPNYRWGGRIPYDFPYLAGAVDFLSPEAYGRIGDWEAVKPGWFEFEYARLAAPMKPMIWAEMGVSTLDISRMQAMPERLSYQAMFFEAFYKMLINSGTDGVFYWWYPGGFRVGENSDFGIINPDGTDRPVTNVIRDNAKRFLDGPSKPRQNYWITIDRDAHPDGVAGVYDAAKADFWSAIDKGKAPGLKTKGTGTDSSNCPLLAVGSGQCNGTNPPKYLDAAIDWVAIRDTLGNWIEVTNGARVKVKTADGVKARVAFTNLGEAELLPYLNGKSRGGVYLASQSPAGEVRTGIPSKVGHLESDIIKEVQLLPGDLLKNDSVTVTISFGANNRTQFGERFVLTLEK